MDVSLGRLINGDEQILTTFVEKVKLYLLNITTVNKRYCVKFYIFETIR